MCARRWLMTSESPHQALAHYSAIGDGKGAGRVSPTRLHTLLALLGRMPPRAAGDDDEEEEDREVKAGAGPRTCVIVAATALGEATLGRLGLLPKCVLALI